MAEKMVSALRSRMASKTFWNSLSKTTFFSKRLSGSTWPAMITSRTPCCVKNAKSLFNSPTLNPANLTKRNFNREGGVSPDGGGNDVISPGSGFLGEKQWKLSVTGDQAKNFLVHKWKTRRG